MNIITDSRCVEYSYPGHPERPARISATLQRLRQQQSLPVTWVAPLSFDDEIILRVHSAAHLRRLEVHLDFDMDTPAYPDLEAHARRSVGGALQALRLARQGEPAFSLFRPPGHHATPDRAMGFCYLNNVAIATLAARAEGIDKVAVFDFDVHHGNGTEQILLDQPGFGFFSIHQFPAYPGTGRKHRNNCRNYPVPPGLPRTAYREVALRAFDDLKGFRPDLIAVSAGFDAYSGDPLCQQRLEAEDFYWFGQTLRELGIPCFSVLEGGYSAELPDLIVSYLRGLSGLEPEAQPLQTRETAPAFEEDPGLELDWGPAF